MTPSPWWLAEPSRWHGLPRARAWVVLAALALLLLASLSAVVTPGPPSASHDPASAAADRADVLLYRGIVRELRGGGHYYGVAAEAQRKGGYPLRPFVTMRLPTLALVQAALPDIVSLALLYALALGVMLAWHRRLAGALRATAPRVIAILLLGCGCLIFVRSDLIAFHEIWSGMLIALSLGLWRPGRWVEAVGVATCAMLIRETAGLYAIVMLVCALAAGRQREALGWGTGLTALGVAVASHYYAWSGVIRTDDPTGPGWSGLLGFGFFAKTLTLVTALAALPEAAGAVLVGFALFGWACWRDPLAVRMLATLAAYAVLLAVFCRTDTYYWGLLIAPASLVGLMFVPDALCDLIAAARAPQRRITITRVVR